jgi:glycosyltransferase involved in cell wall biosynthesis
VSAPIRVAILTDNDFEKINGVTTALGETLVHAPEDLRLRVYTASGLGCSTPDYLALPSWGVGIPFYPDMRMYWPPYRSLLRRLQDDCVDLVHLTTPGPMGLAALGAARRLRVPLVGSFHTDLARYTAVLSGSRALETFMRGYMRWLYAHCSTIFVPSQATRRLVAESGVPASRLRIWSRGVDTEVFTPARRSPALRAEWRAGSDRPVLLYVGRLSREKGVDQLPALHEALVRLGVDHKLVIVGDGPMRREVAAGCPAAARLGTIGRDHLAEVYASADVFVFPSRTDTAGNVVLEAQASGLPVVVSDAGGPREQMVDGLTGTVCADDPVAWVTAVATLLTDAVMRKAAGAAARTHACSRTWPTALAPLYEAYRDIVGARRRAGADPRRVA